MTADKAGSSVARRQLDFATGKARISLAHLFPEEFDALLRDVFREVDTRELRGLKSLQELLTQRPGSFIVGRQDPTECVTVKPFIELRGLMPTDFDLYKTHVANVCRGVLRQKITYRRHESSEETTDREVAESWGFSAYIFKIERALLMLRRTGGLYEVGYSYEKVPHKDEMSVGFIEVKEIALENFRAHFGDRYASVARDLIWELESLVSQTARELQHKADTFRERSVTLSRLGQAVTE